MTRQPVGHNVHRFWIPAFAGIIHGAGAPPQTMKIYFQSNDKDVYTSDIQRYARWLSTVVWGAPRPTQPFFVLDAVADRYKWPWLYLKRKSL